MTDLSYSASPVSKGFWLFFCSAFPSSAVEQSSFHRRTGNGIVIGGVIPDARS